MGGEERRQFARIEASIDCTIATIDRAFDAKVVNVSRTGAALLAPEGELIQGDALTVLLERSEGPISLALSSKVVRIFRQGGDTVYGVRFDLMAPDSEQDLLLLLKLLAAGKGAGRREHPRVSARIAVRCHSRESFGALLNDLSRGGLSIRCPRTVVKGAVLSVEFGLEEHAELISVEGTVVHVELLPDGKSLAGLEFTPPSMAKRAHVQKLLDLLLGFGMRQGVIVEDDDE